MGGSSNLVQPRKPRRSGRRSTPFDRRFEDRRGVFEDGDGSSNNIPHLRSSAPEDGRTLYLRSCGPEDIRTPHLQLSRSEERRPPFLLPNSFPIDPGQVIWGLDLRLRSLPPKIGSKIEISPLLWYVIRVSTGLIRVCASAETSRTGHRNVSIVPIGIGISMTWRIGLPKTTHDAWMTLVAQGKHHQFIQYKDYTFDKWAVIFSPSLTYASTWLLGHWYHIA